jgi:hypothetical protein
MRYVQVQFNPWDRQSYTYVFDGDVKEGDRAEVETQRGVCEVEVVGVKDERPAGIPTHIELKPLLHVLPRAGAA